MTGHNEDIEEIVVLRQARLGKSPKTRSVNAAGATFMSRTIIMTIIGSHLQRHQPMLPGDRLLSEGEVKSNFTYVTGLEIYLKIWLPWQPLKSGALRS